MSEEVVVIGRNYSTSLGVIRALGKEGYESSVIRLNRSIKEKKTPELYSKYVRDIIQTYIGDKEGIVSSLIDSFSNSSEKKLIIPADDFSVSVLDEYHDQLADIFYLPNVGNISGSIIKYMDKGVQKEIAYNCGLNVAQGLTIDIDSDGKYYIPDTIIFPCYTKPQISVGSPKSYIKKCDTIEELRALLEQVAKNGTNTILVEEYLCIDKEYVVPGMAYNGEVIIPAFLEKTKIGSGNHKGVTEKGIVIDSSSNCELRNKLSDMIRSVKLNGLFDIEIIYSGGKYYFNELNLRYGAAGFAVTAAGVNLPGIYANKVTGKKSLNDNRTVKEGISFVSEKVALDDFRAGYSSWKEYKRDIADAEIRFIKSSEDPVPYRKYKIMEVKTRTRRILK